MDLTLIPTDQQPNVIVAILRRDGALTANEAVQGIADAKGDTAAALVVAKLPPLAVAEIVRGFDYSKPGIVGALLTPRQLREAVERLPLVEEGSRTGSLSSVTADVICAAILLANSKKRGEYFRELAKSQIGLLALAAAFPAESFIMFARHKTFEEDGDLVTEATVQVGNWQELALALRTNAPQTFYKVSEVVIASKNGMTDLETELLSAARMQFGTEMLVTDDPFA